MEETAAKEWTRKESEDWGLTGVNRKGIGSTSVCRVKYSDYELSAPLVNSGEPMDLREMAKLCGKAVSLKVQPNRFMADQTPPPHIDGRLSQSLGDAVHFWLTVPWGAAFTNGRCKQENQGRIREREGLFWHRCRETRNRCVWSRGC
jgi:hypothetical protein